MICKNCNAEFDGNFCPNCGAKIDPHPPKAPKKKKPFFLRWWFIVIAVILALFIGLIVSADKIDWDDMVLGGMLPKPPASKGHVYQNSTEELQVDIYDVTEKEFADYIEGCKEKGFTVDAKATTSEYTAYNTEGYSLSLRHYSNLDITLSAPMQMSTINWPSSQAGKQLPAPKSTLGNFTYEQDDSFYVYIASTPKADYDQYVKTCSSKGFSVDYDKGDDYYNAKNSAGWNLRLEYLGNNIMSIEINAPSETTNSASQTKPTESKAPSTDGLSKDFKNAMDSYESFMNEYVDFMKKYKANPTDLGLLSDYTDYMSKYSTFVADFNKWDTSKMSTEEVQYYMEVQTRVNKKLLEVAK